MLSKQTPEFFGKPFSKRDQEWAAAHAERLPQKSDVIAIIIGVTFTAIVTFFADELHGVFGTVTANHIHRLSIIPSAVFVAIAMVKILKNHIGTGMLYMTAMAGCFTTATLSMMR